jgi:hypothetical protein
MKKKTYVGLILFSVVVIAAFLYVRQVAFNDPQYCKSCHYIAPFYKKWETSTHNKVPCLKCHEYSMEKAVAGQFLFLAGSYNPRPLSNVPDKNCLQSGCHEKRLIESKVLFTKWNISFDHKPHFTETRRGMRLHCRSCHSDIVQGEHVKASKSVCYLCHFKGAPHDQAVTGCPTCHTAPKEDIMVSGRPFSHKAALKAGTKCSACHVEITRGEGAVPKDRCYFCHVDRGEKYGDIALIHEKHVVQRQVDCLWCHDRIEHGKIKMAKRM